MQTLDSFSIDKKLAMLHAKKGKGINVQELIQKFKNEANFDTMSKKPKQKEARQMK